MRSRTLFYGCKMRKSTFARGGPRFVGLRAVARKGVSLFAAHHVARGDLVAQYVGEVLTKEAYVERERWVRRSALADMLSVSVTLCGALIGIAVLG